MPELMQNNNIPATKTLTLQMESRKTIWLRDNSIYRYCISQSLSDDIVKVFGMGKLPERFFTGTLKCRCPDIFPETY